jgi:type IV pilus assembly protein PilM
MNGGIAVKGLRLTPSGNHAVGLDIGTSGIRAVEIGYSKGHRVITRAAQIDLPRGSVTNGHITSADDVATALRKLWKIGRFTTTRVNFNISDTNVITRQLELPWMAPDDFRSALKYQVSQEIPVDLSTVQLDFHPIHEFTITDQHGQEIDMLEFLLIAANTETLETTSEAIINAHLVPVGAETSAFALIRAACDRFEPLESRLEAIIDIGADAVTVVIHQGGQPRFIRAMPNQGGDAVALTVALALEITQEDATNRILTSGLSEPPPVISPVPESSVFGALASSREVITDPTAKRVRALINPWATTLVSAIRDSLDYFQATGQRSQVDSLVITGRAASLAGLLERIETETRLPVRLLQPADGFEVSRSAHLGDPTGFSVAIGLAKVGHDD